MIDPKQILWFGQELLLERHCTFSHSKKTCFLPFGSIICEPQSFGSGVELVIHAEARTRRLIEDLCKLSSSPAHVSFRSSRFWDSTVQTCLDDSTPRFHLSHFWEGSWSSLFAFKSAWIIYRSWTPMERDIFLGYLVLFLAVNNQWEVNYTTILENVGHGLYILWEAFT